MGLAYLSSVVLIFDHELPLYRLLPTKTCIVPQSCVLPHNTRKRAIHVILNNTLGTSEAIM